MAERYILNADEPEIAIEPVFLAEGEVYNSSSYRSAYSEADDKGKYITSYSIEVVPQMRKPKRYEDELA